MKRKSLLHYWFGYGANALEFPLQPPIRRRDVAIVPERNFQESVPPPFRLVSTGIK
jgi:hypothetical protein